MKPTFLLLTSLPLLLSLSPSLSLKDNSLPSLPSTSHVLENDVGWKYTFGERSLMSIDIPVSGLKFGFPAISLKVDSDNWALKIDDLFFFSEVLSNPQVVTPDQMSIIFIYKSSPSERSEVYTFSVEYFLRGEYPYICKRIDISIDPPRPFSFEDVWPLKGISISDVSDISRLYKESVIPTNLYGSTVVFHRFENESAAISPIGVFMVVQNPFLNISVASLPPSVVTTIQYTPDMEVSPSSDNLGGFRSDIACIGVYSLSGVTYSHPSVTLIGSSNEMSIDLSERDAISNCAGSFYINPPTTHTVKIHIPWTENDYQIDISNVTQRSEYERILFRLASIGITHTLFTPSDSAVSSVADCSDSWCWEEVLWDTLGEQIRQNEWAPGMNLPPTVEYFVRMSTDIQIRLLPYIYPNLGFEEDTDWWQPGKEEASLGDVAFQNWLIETVIQFNLQTNGDGAGFDYTWLDDPSRSTYSQWFGAHFLLIFVTLLPPMFVSLPLISNSQAGGGSSPH